MAFTYGFYKSQNSDRKYTALQLSSIFDGIISDGVFATIGNALAVAPSTGMGVKVQSGRAWFNHTWSYNDTDYPISIDAAELVLNRIDAIVLEIDSSDAVRANSLKVVKGTPASTPVRPTLTNTEYVHQYALAYVTVTAGTTAITAAMIENNRGSVVTTCPFVTGVINTIDISTLVAQWQAQFTAWMVAQQGDFSTWSTTQRALFDAWFATIQVELDENVAALLLAKCAALKNVTLIELDLDSWSAVSDGWTQTITTDTNGTTLAYATTDNPVLVDNYSGSTSAASKAYFKDFGFIANGENTINVNGSITFKVYNKPAADIIVGLKGV